MAYAIYHILWELGYIILLHALQSKLTILAKNLRSELCLEILAECENDPGVWDPAASLIGDALMKYFSATLGLVTSPGVANSKYLLAASK